MRLEYSTTANCRPEDVWKVFTDSARWSEWSSLLTGMQWPTDAPWAIGSEGVIEIAQPAFKLKVKVKQSSPPSKVVWTGTVMGVNIESAFTFIGQSDNTTLMTAAIDLSGAAVFFINDDMKKKGMAAFAPWFEALRAQAEKSSSVA
ncbi:MAG TPA: SRPBCC family protein [Terriglobales bacterium]|nr:SRPBCC family protein [Terriglobales bacterium]